MYLNFDIFFMFDSRACQTAQVDLLNMMIGECYANKDWQWLNVQDLVSRPCDACEENFEKLFILSDSVIPDEIKVLMTSPL
jgi:hypothetical protein